MASSAAHSTEELREVDGRDLGIGVENASTTERASDGQGLTRSPAL